jgi:hypothetical protein
MSSKQVNSDQEPTEHLEVVSLNVATEVKLLSTVIYLSSHPIGFFRVPSLKDWLTELRLESYSNNFVDSGYEDLEFILLQMNSPK